MEQIRTSSSEKLKLLYKNASTLYDLKFGTSNVEVESFLIPAGCIFEGKPLSKTNLRAHYGLTVVSIKRNSINVPDVEAQTKLFAGDVITAVGDPEKLKKLADYFKSLSLSH